MKALKVLEKLFWVTVFVGLSAWVLVQSAKLEAAGVAAASVLG